MELRDRLKLNWAWPTAIGGTGGYLLTKAVELNSKLSSIVDDSSIEYLVTNPIYTIIIGALIGFGAAGYIEFNEAQDNRFS